MVGDKNNNPASMILLDNLPYSFCSCNTDYSIMAESRMFYSGVVYLDRSGCSHLSLFVATFFTA